MASKQVIGYHKSVVWFDLRHNLFRNGVWLPILFSISWFKCLVISVFGHLTIDCGDSLTNLSIFDESAIVLVYISHMHRWFCGFSFPSSTPSHNLFILLQKLKNIVFWILPPDLIIYNLQGYLLHYICNEN